MIYAQICTYNGNQTTIASRADKPDPSWTVYNVPDSSWLYLDATGAIAIHTQAEMDAAANADLAIKIRAERDSKINRIYWRIQRYQDQTAQGITPTETATTYTALLTYVQALRDVPKQTGFPTSVTWPVVP